MKRRKLLLTLALLLLCAGVNAQTFDTYFEDKTLRVDYLFTGDASQQAICVDGLSALPRWAGRRHHLDKLPLAGNGQTNHDARRPGQHRHLPHVVLLALPGMAEHGRGAHHDKGI